MRQLRQNHAAAVQVPIFRYKAQHGVESGELYQSRALHIACISYHTDNTVAIVRNLLEAKCEVDARDATNTRPLHYACGQSTDSSSAALVVLLLEHGADIHATDGLRRTCLHLACKAGNPELVALLLQRAGSSLVGARDFDLRLPLHYASEASSGPVVQLLFDHIEHQPPDKHILQTTVDRNNESAFHLVVRLKQYLFTEFF